MNIQQIEEEFGVIQVQEGSWVEVFLKCPSCNEDSIIVEIDYEQEGTFKELIECEKCNSKFKSGYFVTPTIILEKI